MTRERIVVQICDVAKSFFSACLVREIIDSIFVTTEDLLDDETDST